MCWSFRLHPSVQLDPRTAFTRQVAMGHKAGLLEAVIVEESSGSTWAEARREWVVDGPPGEDSSQQTDCICQQEGLKYLFSIRNLVTETVISPIGSSCITKISEDQGRRSRALIRQLKKEKRAAAERAMSVRRRELLAPVRTAREAVEQQVEDLHLLKHLDALQHAVAAGDLVRITDAFFDCDEDVLLGWLTARGALPPSPWNEGQPQRDRRFLRDMVDMLDGDEFEWAYVSPARRRKTEALLTQIVSFVWRYTERNGLLSAQWWAVQEQALETSVHGLHQTYRLCAERCAAEDLSIDDAAYQRLLEISLSECSFTPGLIEWNSSVES